MKQIKMGQFAGHYRLVATKLDGTQRVLADWFENLILDAGLNRMGTGNVMGWCQVGSGNTPPAVSDTALQSRIAGTSTLQANVSGNSASAPWYGFLRHTYRFAAGVAAGNLSEVGVGWGTSGAVLFSRALIKDLVGDPTTITVLSDEVLDVTYEIRLYSPTADQTVDVVIGGVTYSTTVRAASANAGGWAPTNLPSFGATIPSSWGLITAYTGTIGTIIQNPSGTSGNASSITASAYANNSYERVFDGFFDLNQGNLSGGIKSMLITTGSGWAGNYQLQFSANIPKDATKILHFKYALSWARYTP